MIRLVRSLLICAALLFGPSAQAQKPLPDFDWFSGNWRIVYDDSALGRIVGMATVTAHESMAQVRTVLHHPNNGNLVFGFAEVGPEDLRDGVLVVELNDAGSPVAGKAAVPQVPVGATIINLPDYDLGSEQLRAVWVNLEAQPTTVSSASLDILRAPGKRITIRLDIPREGDLETLSGRWEYTIAGESEMAGNRQGEVTRIADAPAGAPALRVSGPERWARMAPVISFATTIGQPSLTELEQRAKQENDGTAPGFWLSLGGFNLPVERYRSFEIEIFDTPESEEAVQLRPAPAPALGAAVARPFGFHETWAPPMAQTPEGEPVGVRRNPAHPDILDVRVTATPMLDSRPKEIRIGGAVGYWFPDAPSLEPTRAQFVRRQRSESADASHFYADEYAPAEIVYEGDVIYLEAEYPVPPVATRQIYLLSTGQEQVHKIPLQRLPDNPRLYRSPRLVLAADAPSDRVTDYDDAALLTPEARRALAFWQRRPIAIDADAGNALLALEDDGVLTPDEKTPAVALVGDPPDTTLWLEALRTARACPHPEGGVEINNLIFAEGGFRTITVSDEDHAAALLLRTEMRAALDALAAQLNAANDRPKGTAALLAAQREEARSLTADARRNRIAPGSVHNPLFRIEVDAPHGHRFPKDRLDNVLIDTGGLFAPDVSLISRDKIDRMLPSIANAKGILAQQAARAITQIDAIGDCDVEKNLQLFAGGVGKVKDELLPKLMRRARYNEPRYPRLVPDRVARGHVNSLVTLSNAIAAQDEYANADTNVAVAVVTVFTMGSSAILRAVPRALEELSTLRIVQSYAFQTLLRQAMAETGKLVLAGQLYDAVETTRQSLDLTKKQESYELALGLAGVMGPAGQDRLDNAFNDRYAARRDLILGTAMTLGASGASAFGDFVAAYRGYRDGVAAAASHASPAGLDAAQRRVFDAEVERVRSAAHAGERLSDGDEHLRRLADGHGYQPAAHTVADVADQTAIFGAFEPPNLTAFEDIWAPPGAIDPNPSPLEYGSIGVYRQADGSILLRRWDGQEIRLVQDPAADYIGEGAFSQTYRVPGHDDIVIKLTKNVDALDEFGRNALEQIDVPGPPRNLDDLALFSPRVHEQFPIDASDLIPSLREGVEHKDFTGGTMSIIETAPDAFASLGTQAANGGMTPGQIVAYQRGMEALNTRGYAWLDNKHDNFGFVPVDEANDRWVLSIHDPGGIVPVRSAEEARGLQQLIDNPGDDVLRFYRDNPNFAFGVHRGTLAEAYDDAVLWDQLPTRSRDNRAYNTLNDARSDDPDLVALPYNPINGYQYPRVGEYLDMARTDGDAAALATMRERYPYVPAPEHAPTVRLPPPDSTPPTVLIAPPNVQPGPKVPPNFDSEGATPAN